MRYQLLDLPLDCLTREQTVAELERRIDEGQVTQHVVLNASKVLQCREDTRLSSIVRDCGIVNADGMAVVWAGRLMGLPVPERVTGIDLLDDLWDLASRRGLSVYLLGAAQDVLDDTVRLAQSRGVRVAGAHHGFWESDAEIVKHVRASGADILFIALPSPRKELFLAEWLDDMGVSLAVGVGGSFDVLSGRVRRAPRWMQQAGLEWLARLIQEPRRLARRYLVGNLKFVLLVSRQYLVRSTG